MGDTEALGLGELANDLRDIDILMHIDSELLVTATVVMNKERLAKFTQVFKRCIQPDGKPVEVESMPLPPVSEAPIELVEGSATISAYDPNWVPAT